MRLIAYLRVSSAGQEDGYGFDVQREHIANWARRNRHRIVGEFVEVFTGTAGVDVDEARVRPELEDALTELRDSTADGIVAGKLDRFARRLTVQEAILAMIWRGGKKAFTAEDGEILKDDPDDPMRTAIRQMQGVFAELDRGMVVKRMRDGRLTKAAAGRHAYGQYRYGQRGVGEGRTRDAGPNPDEQVVAARIKYLREVEQLPYRAICVRLDADGIRPRYAESWSPMTVRNIALRPVA